MEPEKEYAQSHEQMAVVEKYEAVIAYLYPIAQNIGRRHGVAKAMFIECLLGQVQLIVEAGKSGQISRLYIADAGLSQLRFWLRFLVSKPVRSITLHQVETAQVLIAEVGRMLRAGDHESLGRFIASWRGHAAHADACNLFNHLEERYGVACH